MAKHQALTSLLGIDIGQINTRVSLFSISEGKYRLKGSQSTDTSLGYGLHLGAGAGAAMRVLQEQSGHAILKPSGGLLMPADGPDQGVDRVVLTTSAGPSINTVLLGLTEKGSLKTGNALVDSLPLKLVKAFGLADDVDESDGIGALIQSRPEIVIITGGEDMGAKRAVNRWVELVRLFCLMLPRSLRPVLLYAGNPLLETNVRRRLEPLTALYIVPNLQPVHGEKDLVPAQMVLDREILREWSEQVPGLVNLSGFPNSLIGTKEFSLGRMVRFLSRTKNKQPSYTGDRGVLAVDLGGGRTTISAGVNGKTASVVQPTWGDLLDVQDEETSRSVYQWTAAPVTRQDVNQFLSHQSLNPSVVPETLNELAISQSFARACLRRVMCQVSENYPWFNFDPDEGLKGQYEPMIASGAVLSQAPTPGQAMMMLLDALQPWGITTIVLDKQHLLPLLGLMGESDPVLPIHILDSAVFENLGTVLTAVSDLPEGETVLTVEVMPETGKDYSVDIVKGTLRRLIVPAGVSVVLTVQPNDHTDVGFGSPGIGGQLKVTGGTLGVIIDARGRPLKLPTDGDLRVEQLRRWLWSLGG